jgi:hypothetical protein
VQVFKTQHFKREHPSRSFPWYRSLSQAEVAAIRVRIAKALKLNSQDPENLVRAVEEKGALVAGKKADIDQFQISALLAEFGIRSSQNVFINWNRYDDIDEMGLDDLNRYFPDIWYPGSDDIDVFDSSLEWFLSISPEGYINVVRTAVRDSPI